jgi:hypothetical protein
LFFRPWFCRKTSFLTKIAEDDLSLYYRALENHSSHWCLPKVLLLWLQHVIWCCHIIWKCQKHPKWLSYRWTGHRWQQFLCTMKTLWQWKHVFKRWNRVFKCNWQLSFGLDERAISVGIMKLPQRVQIYRHLTFCRAGYKLYSCGKMHEAHLTKLASIALLQTARGLRLDYELPKQSPWAVIICK